MYFFDLRFLITSMVSSNIYNERKSFQYNSTIQIVRQITRDRSFMQKVDSPYTDKIFMIDWLIKTSIIDWLIKIVMIDWLIKIFMIHWPIKIFMIDWLIKISMSDWLIKTFMSDWLIKIFMTD